MAITTSAIVKGLAGYYTKSGTTAPTTSTVGAVGDLYLVTDGTDSGKSYFLTAIVTDPSTSYTWTQDLTYDYQIGLMITKAENDYLELRGVPFETDDGDETVYPTGSDVVAGEMVCYLIGIGQYEGRHRIGEGLAGASATYDPKLGGYPRSISSQIKRYSKLD
jgi:hypothetical protein